MKQSGIACRGGDVEDNDVREPPENPQPYKQQRQQHNNNDLTK